jgi:hypothetical protein
MEKISSRRKSRARFRAFNDGAPTYTASAPASIAARKFSVLPAGARSSIIFFNVSKKRMFFGVYNGLLTVHQCYRIAWKFLGLDFFVVEQ